MAYGSNLLYQTVSTGSYCWIPASSKIADAWIPQHFVKQACPPVVGQDGSVAAARGFVAYGLR